jgi:hypothetical protein
VFRRKLAAIHFVGEQNVSARFFNRNAPGKVQLTWWTFRIFERAAIRSLQNDFTRVWFHTGSLKKD